MNISAPIITVDYSHPSQTQPTYRGDLFQISSAQSENRNAKDQQHCCVNIQLGLGTTKSKRKATTAKRNARRPGDPITSKQWKAVLHLLGKMSDRSVAAIIGCGATTVRNYRNRHGIPAYERQSEVDWDSVQHLFARRSDPEIAEILGCSRHQVARYRKKHGIPSSRRRSGKTGRKMQKWSEVQHKFTSGGQRKGTTSMEYVAMRIQALGKMSKSEV